MNKRYYIFSPVPFFLFGMVYYLIIPYLGLSYLQDYKFTQIALNYIDLSFFNMAYWSDLFIIFISWYSGYKVFSCVKSKSIFIDKVSSFKISPLFLFILFTSILLFAISNCFKKGIILFSGYSSYDVTVLGQFTTLIFMSVFFVNFFQIKKSKNMFIILFIIVSSIILGLGSRMFFVLGSISLFLGYLSINIHFLKSIKFYIILFVLFCFVIFIGIWRSSSYELSLEMFVSIFTAEPTFTLVSSSLYIDNIGERPYSGIPKDVLASVVNFVPTILFPDKLEIISNLIDDPSKDSPFGASGLLVNLYSNFGFFYPIYLFFVGGYVGYLRKMAYKSAFFRASYFSILPMFMFHFYREGFITVIKVLFFNAFILPLILLFLLYLILSRKVYE